MEALYPVFLIIHLFCAIIFVGYLFFDCVIYPNIKKLGENIDSKVASAISKRAGKIMPICVLLLFITGGAMLSRYVGLESGFFTSNLQKILMLKVLLASIIFIAIIISLSCFYIFKCKNPLGKIIHPLALFLAFFIIIFAKIMFYV